MSLISEIFDGCVPLVGDLTQILLNNEFNEELFYYANLRRKLCVGDEIHLKALIEISNICTKTCKYCGLRAANSSIERYKMPKHAIKKAAKDAVERGFKTVVLQSGESSAFSTDEICELVSYIDSLGVQITLSLGEKSFDELKAYKEAGANRYLLRIETTDSPLYKKIHPKMSHEHRFLTLRNLQNLGYETGSGLIVGLPEQSHEMLAKDLLWLHSWDFDMAGIGPFIACSNTPFQNCKNGSFELSTKVMALLRLLLPKINIPATTAMENLVENGRLIALERGANVIMPNFTDKDVKMLYKIYKKKLIDDTNLAKDLAVINRFVSAQNGDSLRFTQRQMNGQNAS